MPPGPVQVPAIEAFAEDWLRANSYLPPTARQSLSALLPQLLQRLNTDRYQALGLSGPPGSGKSTLAGVLVHCLQRSGIPACLLSLDDYYLQREQRRRLAREIHPLFRQRGVPGTHELPRLFGDLDRLRKGDVAGLKVPVFDKSIDDRSDPAQWRKISQSPRVTVLEGWCLGAPPQPAAAWTKPVNELERREDPDGTWRSHVHRAWTELHAGLENRFDRLWYLRPPDWRRVIDWRWQQEQELSRPRLESREDVANFLAAFERIGRYMHDGCADWADLCLPVDDKHHLELAVCTP